MPRSLFDQLLQIAASTTYDDAVSGAHTVGIAEGQTELQGDLNVVRTLVKDLAGVTAWYENPTLSVQGISDKYFQTREKDVGFDNVSVSGNSTTAFDAFIKNLANHNDGAGTSTTDGVVINSTQEYKLILREADTNDPINDGNNNEVYGRLDFSGGQYVINFYSSISGVETPYTFAAPADIDLAFVVVSRKYADLPWERFHDLEFHDVSPVGGSVTDANVSTGPWSLLLAGLTTQQQVNDKLDKLGSAASGEGASGIAVENAANYYSGADIETLLGEISTQFGADSSSTYNFTDNNVVADDDAVYPAIDKLDVQWGRLNSTNTNEGASLVGVEDAAGSFTSDNVEGVLIELQQNIEDVGGWDKQVETTSAPITAGAAHTLPGSMTYTPDSGKNLDVYFSGQLLTEGATNDYVEDTSTTIRFNFTVPNNKNMTYMSRK